MIGSGEARMSRAVRATRGAAGAASATLFAAASHALAGGAITWFAIVASAILALPICTALAGRIGSLWRLVLSVAVSQFVFHWSFSGLGLASGAASGTAAAVDGASASAPHAAHLGALTTFAPALVSTGASTAGVAMWAGHAIATIATIALLHRGERAFLRLVGMIRRALPTAAPQPIPLAAPAGAERQDARSVAPLLDRLLTSATISHRGPPSAAVGAGC